MKSVLISIQPKWVELIASGKKTIEVRKSAPKLETPFKCYIYCTKDKYQHLYDLRPYTNDEISLSLTQHNKTSLVPQNYWNGKVIGEFVCDRIQEITYTQIYNFGRYKNVCELETRLDFYALDDYLKQKNGYGWHISDLKIYDQPKELSEFRLPCTQKQCASWCKDMKVEGAICLNKDKRFITRPPQSWCYVEVE